MNNHPCPDADLWILAGQSNMEGCGWFSETFEADPRIWSFNSQYAWVPGTPPLHNLIEAKDPVHRNLMLESGYFSEAFLAEKKREFEAGKQERRCGPGYFFARALLEKLPAGRAIALLPVAHGGTTLDQWSPELAGEPGTTLYGAMLKRLKASGLKPKGMLWYQGESDALPELCGTYEERFLRFAERLRADVGVADLPILSVQLGRVGQWDHLEPWDAIRQTQHRLGESCPRHWVTSAIDLGLCDQIHIDFEGHKRLGKRLARLALTHAYGVEQTAGNIRLESIEALPPRPLLDGLPFMLSGARLRFSGVQGELKSAGLPWGFDLLTEPAKTPALTIFRTELNAAGPGVVDVHLPDCTQMTRIGIGYGLGLNPACNVTDELDNPLPAFAPAWLGMPA